MTPFAYDFYHLWASGKVARLGGNPYAPEQITPLMLESGWPPSEAVSGFMHPFWSLWIFCPLSLMPFPLAVLLWETTIVALVAWAVRLVYHAVSSQDFMELPQPRTAFLAIALFPPFISTVAFGQTSALLLVGFVGWLLLFFRQKPFAAGIALSLTALKPHIFIPLYAWIFVSELRRGRGSCPLGFAAGIMLQSCASLAFASHVASQWLSALSSMSTTTLTLPTPSCARILSDLLGIPGAQNLLVVIVTATIAMYALITKRTITPKAAFVFLALGCITTPYTWSHSFVILTLPYLCLMERIERRGDKWVLSTTLPLAVFGILETCYVSTLAPFSAAIPLALLALSAYSLSIDARLSGEECPSARP